MLQSSKLLMHILLNNGKVDIQHSTCHYSVMHVYINNLILYSAHSTEHTTFQQVSALPSLTDSGKTSQLYTLTIFETTNMSTF